jgi:transcription initiation factor TFIIIB Brf1 subunit/transcription initiation factor TFIIB
MAYFDAGVCEQACPDCGGTNIAIDRREADAICTDCGLVLQGRMIDFRAEWNGYQDDAPDPCRVGAPVVQVKGRDVGLGLAIGKSRQTADGNTMHPKSKVETLQRLQLWSMPSKDRDVFRDRDKIAAIVEDLCLSSAVTDAAFDLFDDYVTASDKNPRGANRACAIAACIFFACRMQSGMARTLEEIMYLSNVERGPLNKSVTALQRTMSSSKHKHLFMGVAGSPIDAVVRKVEMLVAPQHLRFPVVKQCRAIFQHLQDRRVCITKNPDKFLAAILSIAFEKLNMTDVVETKALLQACGNVSEKTFVDHVQFLKENLQA